MNRFLRLKTSIVHTSSARIVSVIGLAFFLSCTSSPSIEEKVAQADELVQGTLEEHHLPGISVTVLQAGEQIYSKGFGYADIAEERTINPSETRFRIGSFSKTLAASAMMRLVEAEKVHLDSSIYHYVPNYPKKKWDFTPRQVGGHLSGIRHYNGQEMLIDTYYTNVSDALSIFSADTLLHEPGSKYHYSTHAWTLFSAVIEEAAEVAFLDYMASEVFEPLAMGHTHAETRDLVGVEKVSYYLLDSTQTPVLAPEVDNSWKWAGGGFISTTEDVASFLWQHAREGYLTTESLEALKTPQTTSTGESTNYGIGWANRQDGHGHRLVGHTGGSVGGTTYAFMSPETETVVVMTTNLSSASFGNLANELFEVFE